MKLNYTGKENLKFLVLSDLHISKKDDISKIKKMVLKITETVYDGIFIVGDIIDSISVLESRIVKSKVFNLFLFFANIAHTFFVTGNHDVLLNSHRKQKSTQLNEKKLKAFYDELAKIENVEFLKNKTVTIGNNFTVSGLVLDDKWALSKSDEYFIDEKQIELLKELPVDKTNILLCHFPNFLMHLSEKGYLKNVDYSIAGHNHNGATQFRFIPLEPLLNLIGQKNRGLITPFKSIKLKDTAKLRGVLKLGDNTTLIINPAFKTLSFCSKLEKLDWMFYKGYTEVIYTNK